MFIGNVKHDTIITKIKVNCVSFAPHSRIFLVVGSSISTARTTVRNCHDKVFRSLTSHPKLAYSMKTCSWPLCVLWYSCFIPRLNFVVVIPRPESSLSVNMQVGRKIVGAKIEIVNCLLFVCTRKWRFKIVFRKPNCSTATEDALVWVINGSTSDSESLDTARLFRLLLAFTANN